MQQTRSFNERRCHRRIITDYPLAAGEQVLHILGPGKIAPATLTKGARPQPDGALTYPPEATKVGSMDDSMFLP
jgi:hypothetical protein